MPSDWRAASAADQGNCPIGVAVSDNRTCRLPTHRSRTNKFLCRCTRLWTRCSRRSRSPKTNRSTGCSRRSSRNLPDPLRQQAERRRSQEEAPRRPQQQGCYRTFSYRSPQRTRSWCQPFQNSTDNCWRWQPAQLNGAVFCRWCLQNRRPRSLRFKNLPLRGRSAWVSRPLDWQIHGGPLADSMLGLIARAGECAAALTSVKAAT